MNENKQFIIPKEIYEPKYLFNKITVLFTTSPIGSNPSTAIIDEVFDGCLNVKNLEYCKKIIICDGYKLYKKSNYKGGKIKNEEVENYNKFIYNVQERIKNEYYSNITANSIPDQDNNEIKKQDIVDNNNNNNNNKEEVIRKKRKIQNEISKDNQRHKLFFGPIDFNLKIDNINPESCTINIPENKISFIKKNEICEMLKIDDKTPRWKRVIPQQINYITPLTKIIRIQQRVGFGFAVREALKQIDTPYVIIIQHDLKFQTEIDLPKIIYTMETYSDRIKYIGFATNHVTSYARRCADPALPRILSPDPSLPIPLIPLFFWYDKTHIASVQHYLKLVFGRGSVIYNGDFIEDKFGHVQLQDIKEHGMEVHSKYGTWMYFPKDEEREKEEKELKRKKIEKKNYNEQEKNKLNTNIDENENKNENENDDDHDDNDDINKNKTTKDKFKSDQNNQANNYYCKPCLLHLDGRRFLTRLQKEKMIEESKQLKSS
ncbi:hypothetical protein H8356DRAFT_957956 [Neocallimastix lanati (nom. inval.)]|jgi:hypothetical protein|uniref:Uncharacterized protein n=1 Tax=Neocallimastix californiae TaxID=1754190 RepID=A0A1Y1YV26_9FUNG|nr:hypothetical protein H8356DRAFT_957956 [Neocallimastix sp. JGI-2020a]ORY01888.1 hypothetical protein LY90DRAFT_678653 [Neocallimastix californiae]|eukprot:ORY01888.1 hypothetical protein LY90DRAFT_678653 [Neocallimastix californiae]